MKRLELPKTIRLATKDEVPNDPHIYDNIDAGNEANIVEGYVIYPNTSHELPFTFFAEINIDNSRLWPLLESIVSKLPVKSCLIFRHIDHEPYITEYEETVEIFEIINRYKTELSQDGYLEFGLLYQDENILNEVFVKKAKYVQYWGTDKNLFTQIMRKYNLDEVKDLNFVDEYPMITESLSLQDSIVTETSVIINTLRNNFIFK